MTIPVRSLIYTNAGTRSLSALHRGILRSVKLSLEDGHTVTTDPLGNGLVGVAELARLPRWQIYLRE